MQRRSGLGVSRDVAGGDRILTTEEQDVMIVTFQRRVRRSNKMWGRSLHFVACSLRHRDAHSRAVCAHFFCLDGRHYICVRARGSLVMHDMRIRYKTLGTTWSDGRLSARLSRRCHYFETKTRDEASRCTFSFVTSYALALSLFRVCDVHIFTWFVIARHAEKAALHPQKCVTCIIYI